MTNHVTISNEYDILNYSVHKCDSCCPIRLDCAECINQRECHYNSKSKTKLIHVHEFQT